MKIGFNMLLWTTHVTEEDLPLLETLKKVGYDGVEIPIFEGDVGHFEKVDKALEDDRYSKVKGNLLKEHDLQVLGISNHLVGQAVCDNIDERHKAILPEDVWGGGDPEGLRKRAAEKMIQSAKAAKKLGANIINKFTSSPIWNVFYSFLPAPLEMIEAEFAYVGTSWNPILDIFDECVVQFALGAHSANGLHEKTPKLPDNTFQLIRRKKKEIIYTLKLPRWLVDLLKKLFHSP